MTNYEKELQQLRPHDTIQATVKETQDKGYSFIMTASHGYLVVPRNDPRVSLAYKLCQYGYKGLQALYLEEDCEAPEFLSRIA